jgi:transketolase
VPETIGGSADLTGSNNTKSQEMKPVTATDFSGRYIHWGVREHGMGAAMNGIALHGGLIPYGGTFLVFSDYCRPSIRLAALMGNRVIFVMTHDSIGLGEDGPTHQPVEQLAALRAIPGMHVMRPADANETAEAWRVALAMRDAPVALVLTRQDVPTFDRARCASAEGLRRGAYVLADAPRGLPQVILIGTGSEVSLCMAARARLADEGIEARVVSMPCWELFARQDEAYRESVLPAEVAARVAVEQASDFGWSRWVGERGATVCMTSFGASAPYQELQRRFGFTVENVMRAAKKQLSLAKA